MDSASFEKLIRDQPPDIKAKGILLFNGVLKGKTAYQAEPIVAKLKDWRASESALDEFIASLNVGLTNEKTFTGIPAVVEYLHSQGWKISLRTGYNHRDKRILLPRKDGKYYQSDIDRYAQTGVLPRLDGIKQEIIDSEIERKKRADADISEYEARIKRIKAEAIEGKYVERQFFEDALAKRAAVFKSDIENFIRVQAEKIIKLVEGNPIKTPELIEHYLDVAADWLNRYASDKEIKAMVPAVTSAVPLDIAVDDPDDENEHPEDTDNGDDN